MVSVRNAVNAGSVIATVPNTTGPIMVACTAKASGPTRGRPVMRAAAHPTHAAARRLLSALGRRMANAFSPKAHSLAAIIHIDSGGFSSQRNPPSFSEIQSPLCSISDGMAP